MVLASETRRFCFFAATVFREYRGAFKAGTWGSLASR